MKWVFQGYKRVFLGYVDAWMTIIYISLIITFVTQFYPVTKVLVGFIYKPSDSIFLLLVGILWGIFSSAVMSCIVAFTTAICLMVLCVPLNIFMFTLKLNSLKYYIATGIISGLLFSIAAYFLADYNRLFRPLYLSILFLPFTSWTYWRTARPDLNDDEYEHHQEALEQQRQEDKEARHAKRVARREARHQAS